jgi:FkbM family methyltransferase
MKILWHSVAPFVGTGYGQQTATFTPRIAALGHDVAISAYYGLYGSRLRWNGLACYPAYAAPYGTDVVVTHALDHFEVEGKPFPEAAASGLILTLTDVWVLSQPLLADMCVASWAPVDHLELPGITRRWFEQIGAQPIAMSRFGERAMADADLSPLYVPHGIDTSVFRPGDRAEARDRTGLPADAFVVAMVAANVGRDGNRKAFAEQITAFAELRRRHDDALLVLHTDVDSRHGENIHRCLERLPEGSYIYTDQYAYRRGIPAEVIADIYRAADVLTNCSWGEGFGIPIVEAQACGTPVVVTDATAMPELCGAGWRVSYTPLWHESQDAWCAVPHVADIVDAYLEAYDHAAGLRQDAAAFGAAYDADFVTDTYWVPALKALEEGLEARMEDARKPRPPTPKVVESDGLLWIDRGKGTEDALGPAPGHELALGPKLEQLIPEDGIVLEVGAHVGHWTLRLAARAAAWIAVEANPDTASILRRNLAINDIHNVQVLPVAAWDSATELWLDDPHGHQAGGSTRTLEVDGRAELAHPDGPPTVPARPLDELLDFERLDLVKLDVEGADLHALRGMSGLLRQHHPVLFIECHDYCGYYTRAELEDLLAELGYTWRIAHTYPSTWSPTGTLAEPVDADYLVCTPVASTHFAELARIAVADHGASQRADELAAALELIDRQAPRVIVEIGCDTGGTLYAWRAAFPDADVYGITLADNSYASGGTDRPLVDHGATVYVGDSHDPAARRQLVEDLASEDRDVDVLVLDGDHSVDGIRRDLMDYATLVRPGGLILLHDITSVGDPRAEVHKVWPAIADEVAVGLGRAVETEEIRSPAGGYGWGIVRLGAKVRDDSGPSALAARETSP